MSIKDNGNYWERYHSKEVWGSKAVKPLAQHTPPWPEWLILVKITSISWRLTKNLTEMLSDRFWRCFGSPRKGWWLSWTCLHSWKCILRQSCATWHWLVHKPGCFFPKSWMYSEDLNNFPQDVWLDSWNLSHVIWICMNLLVSLFSPNSLNLQVLS